MFSSSDFSRPGRIPSPGRMVFPEKEPPLQQGLDTRVSYHNQLLKSTKIWAENKSWLCIISVYC